MDARIDKVKSDIFIVKYWLIGFLILVLVMIAVGGATRLTRSGLSITEWRPISGFIPPMSEFDWKVEFDKYKKTPEYRELNNHFEINDFKSIFLWEYTHRSIGRILFLYALLPGLYFWRRGKISVQTPVFFSSYITFQGFVGWLMVKSGLSKVPAVSPFLLAFHYFLALGLLIFIFRELCQFRTKLNVDSTQLTSFLTKAIGVALGVQIFYGCLMSGYKAGYLSDTFPMINGKLLPTSVFSSSFSIINLVELPFLINWVHRWLGLLTVILVSIHVYLILKSVAGKDRRPYIHFWGVTTSQIFLGVALVKFHIPILVAISHQIIAALIVLGYFNIVFRAKT
ncbi:MAG: COX15/CtaA family protein [Bdellovibrio sp.]|nr:COX15/CtaA family protein [Bdellovibrio sp.]